MAATERLLVEHGKAVSTREIAEAAGIAEGTIFRVFATKDAIIDAIFDDAFDGRADRVRMEGLEPGASLEDCLVEVVSLTQRRIQRVMALFAAVGFRQPQGRPEILEQRSQGYDAIAKALTPYASQLRTRPDAAARLLHGVVLAMTHPMLTDRPITDPAAVVALVLHGIAANPEGSPAR
ncbi:MAG: helix-turn-helix domain-containing protein [Croceibacterium sp.]